MDFARQLTQELGLTEKFSESFTIVYGFQADNILAEFISSLRNHGYETSLVGEIDCEGGLSGVGQLVIYRKRGEKPRTTVLNLDHDCKLTVEHDNVVNNMELKGPHRLIIKPI